MENTETREILDSKYELLRWVVDSLSIKFSPAEMFSPPLESRRKIEFKFQNNQLGFFLPGSHKLTRESLIEQAICPEIQEFRRYFETINFRKWLGNCGEISVIKPDLGGLSICFKPDKKVFLSPEQQTELVKGLSALNISELTIKQPDGSHEPLAKLEQAGLSLGGIEVEITPDSFVQPTYESEKYMQDIISESIREKANLVDLFSGIGTFGLSSQKPRRVSMFDNASLQLKATEEAIKARKIKNTRIFKRDLMKYPLRARELEEYNHCILNPPRSGAKEQCRQISEANLSVVIMVSCSPRNFIRDARILFGGGWKARALYPVNQFLFTKHLELVGVFEKSN